MAINIGAQLKLNIQNFTNNLNAAAASMQAFGKNMSGQTNNGTQQTKKLGFAFKDVGRIIQGILVSRFFYDIIQSVRGATREIWAFSQELEVAKISFSSLFGDTALADNLVNVLQDFAATTIFSFSEAEQAARRLLAYGIKAENVMYVMKGVMNAAAATGNAESVERVSRALGQIYTKGRLMNEEMRQLAEAGIPAYDILREKLGLTQKQLQNLGRQSIPASDAINALIDGINERYGALGTAIMTTTKGMISNIKDNLLLIGNELFTPLFSKIKAKLFALSTTLMEWWNTVKTSGIGGLFEKLVPPDMQGPIRLLIANFALLGSAIKDVVTALGAFFGQLGNAAIVALNMLMPAITSIVSVLGGMLQRITQNSSLMQTLAAVLIGCATAWVIWKAAALGAAIVQGLIGIINGVAAAVMFLSKVLLASPIMWFVGLVAGGIAIAAGAVNVFKKAVTSIGDEFNKMRGVDSGGVLLPESKKRASDLGKFNKALDGTSKGLDKVAGSAGGAAKAGKGLLGFDEVFKLSPDEAGGGGLDTALDDLMDDLSGLGGGGGLDIATPIQNFINRIKDTIGEKLINAGIGTLIGSVLGGIIGGLVGGPAGVKIGAAIGAFAGAFAGWFWDDICAAIGLNETSWQEIAIGTAIGAVFGKVIGGPGGALIGAAIGALATGVSTLLWEKLAGALGKSGAGDAGMGSTIGMAIGAAIGMAISPGLGTALGALAGNIVGGFVGMFWSDLIAFFNEFGKDGTMWGAIIGTVAGGLAGTTVGTKIGAAIGSAIAPGIGTALGAILGGVIGTAIGLVIDNWNTWWPEVVQAITFDFSQLFVDIDDGVIQPLKDAWANIEAAFDTAWQEFKDSLADIQYEIIYAFAYAWDEVKNVFVEAWNSIVDAFGGLFGGKKLAEPVDSATKEIKTSLGQTNSDIGAELHHVDVTVDQGLSNVATTAETKAQGIWSGVTKWFTNITSDASNFASSVYNGVTAGFGTMGDAVSNGLSKAYTGVSTFFSSIVSTADSIMAQINASAVSWFAQVRTSIATAVSNAAADVASSFSSIYSAVANKCTLIYNSVSTSWRSMVSFISATMSTIWSDVTTWFTNIWKTAVEKLNGLLTEVKTILPNILQAFKSWINDMWTNIFKPLLDWIDNVISRIKEMLKLKSSTSTSGTTGTTAKNTSTTTTGKVDLSKVSSPKTQPTTSKTTTTSKTSAKTSTTTSSGKTSSLTKTKKHALGGIFGKHHLAEVAEGDKKEAIIPLENTNAMQPFVDAVANGLTTGLAPMLAAVQGYSVAYQMPILYVGTLIADDKGLAELNKRMRVIQAKDDARRGLNG